MTPLQFATEIVILFWPFKKLFTCNLINYINICKGIVTYRTSDNYLYNTLQL